jgi:transcriptional regulator with XRE-family HTH domain
MISIERIEERMKALGLNPFSAAKRAGLGQDYVRDIVRGKVKEPSASKLRDLAAALECSTEYLQGVGDELGELPVTWGGSTADLHVARLVVEKEIRDGFHKSHKPRKDESFAVVSYNYRGSSEWLEFVRDSQLENEITSGTYIHTIGVDKYFDGLTNIVIFEKSTEKGDLTSRRVGRLHFSARGVNITGDGEFWSPSDVCSWEDLISGRNKARAKVVGLAIRAYQFFNGDFNEDEMGI